MVPEVVLFTLDAGGDPKGVVRERRQLESIGAALASTLDIADSDFKAFCKRFEVAAAKKEGIARWEAKQKKRHGE